jgi:hypothetical protein
MLVLLAKIARSLRSLPEASVSRGVKSVFNKFRRIFRDTVSGREKRRGGVGKQAECNFGVIVDGEGKLPGRERQAEKRA